MKRERRWKTVALLATGVAIGTVMVGTPAGAHVASWAHNWNTHIKPKVNQQSVRVARANTGGGALGTSNAVVETVSITAPAKGFVWVDADYNVVSGTACPCSAWVHLRDAVSGQLVPNYKILQTSNGGFDSGSMSWVFEVEKGARTFELLARRELGTALVIDGITLKAMYIPFGPTGGKVLTRPAAGASVSGTD